MKTRWKILIVAGILLLLAAASAWVTAHHQPQNAVEDYKKILRDKGEKLEISEVLPPPVPDASNGVRLVEAAFKSFIPADEAYSNLPPAMLMIAAGKALVVAAQPHWFESGKFDCTNSWESAQLAVEANRMAAALLTEAATYPAMDFHLDYAKGYDFDLPHLQPLKRSAQRLSAAAMCDLHSGNTASAATNICVLLSLIQASQDERIWISQLVRVAMSGIALNTTWELLQSTNASDEELSKLRAHWTRLDFFSGAEGAGLMERAWAERVVKALHTSVSEFGRIMGSSSSGSAWSFTSSGNWLEDIGNLTKEGWAAGKGYGGIMMWQNSWGYSDELRLLQKRQIELETLRAARTNQVLKPLLDRQEAEFAAMKTTGSSNPLMRVMEWERTRWLFSETIFGSRHSIKRFTSAEVAKQMVVVAIALKRFQVRHEKYPEKLSELAPEFLLLSPLDPMDGKPLRYHPNADGTFLLYSVGEDGVDDGGDATPVKSSSSSTPNWNWQRARDWVWPQPASAEEVKNYYDEQAARAAAEAAASAAMPEIDASGLPMPPPPSN